MKDILTAGLTMQKAMLDAQRAQLDAAGAGLAAWMKLVGTGDAMLRAGKAQQRAMDSWLSLWGGRS